MSTLKQGHVIEVKENSFRIELLDFDYGDSILKTYHDLSYSYWHAGCLSVYRRPNVGEKVEIILNSSNNICFIKPARPKTPIENDIKMSNSKTFILTPQHVFLGRKMKIFPLIVSNGPKAFLKISEIGLKKGENSKSFPQDIADILGIDIGKHPSETDLTGQEYDEAELAYEKECEKMLAIYGEMEIANEILMANSGMSDLRLGKYEKEAGSDEWKISPNQPIHVFYEENISKMAMSPEAVAEREKKLDEHIKNEYGKKDSEPKEEEKENMNDEKENKEFNKIFTEKCVEEECCFIPTWKPFGKEEIQLILYFGCSLEIFQEKKLKFIEYDDEDDTVLIESEEGYSEWVPIQLFESVEFATNFDEEEEDSEFDAHHMTFENQDDKGDMAFEIWGNSNSLELWSGNGKTLITPKDAHMLVPFVEEWLKAIDYSYPCVEAAEKSDNETLAYMIERYSEESKKTEKLAEENQVLIQNNKILEFDLNEAQNNIGRMANELIKQTKEISKLQGDISYLSDRLFKIKVSEENKKTKANDTKGDLQKNTRAEALQIILNKKEHVLVSEGALFDEGALFEQESNQESSLDTISKGIMESHR